MKRKFLILGIFACVSIFSFSQEVNMNRWIDIKFREGWDAPHGERTINLHSIGDSANTKIKIVSGWREVTKTIGEDWDYLNTEFF